MDGEDRTNDEHTSAPAEVPAEAPHVSTQRSAPRQQPSISEQAFVDRIKRSDRWLIVLTATIAISSVVSAGIFWRQLDAMRGQLTEMTATRESGDRSMAAQLEILQAQAASLEENTRISDESLLSQRRAWLWPQNLKVESSLEVGIRPNLRVPVINTGREPAEFVSANIRTDYGEVTKGAKAENSKTFPVWSLHSGELQWQSLCKGLQPEPGNALVYPSQTPSIFMTVDESLVDLREIRSRAKLLVLLGCIAYQTSGKAHFSSFCQYLQPVEGRPIGEWTITYCPAGNHGD